MANKFKKTQREIEKDLRDKRKIARNEHLKAVTTQKSNSRPVSDLNIFLKTSAKKPRLQSANANVGRRINRA
jgi:hypothetical protein